MPAEAEAERFEDLYASHREGILRDLHRMTREFPLAEDLTQETFARAARGLDRFRGESKVATWLYRIATNVYLDQRRKEASRAPETPEAEPELSPDAAADPEASTPKLPDRLLEDSEMGRCVREFVDGLSPEHRAVIVLHDLEGLKNREIADVLGCSLDAVKIRVHRARQTLRSVLGENCEFYRGEDDVLRCDRKPTDESP
jgi:RNA polymerase sigma-70 factor (ECF subfamily)